MNLIKQAQTLLEDQETLHQAVLDYLRDSSWINSGLRGNGGKNHHPKQAAATKSLDLVMSPLSEMVLYRAVSRHAFEDYSVGDEFVDRGFVSTCKHKANANHPGYVHPDDRMILTINVPAGVHGLDMKEFISKSEFAPQKAKELVEWEDEILLQRNLKFKFVRKSKKAAILQIIK